MATLKKTYDYVDETGRLLSQTVRYEPKAFRQRRPNPDQPGKWLWNLDGVRRVLYRLPAVLQERQLILIVEGEKDVATAETLGFVATTAQMGAGKWRPEYTASLAGVDTVVLIPDNDEPGQADVQQKAAALVGRVKHLKIVTLPGVPDKGDLSDWYAQAKDKRALAPLLLQMIADAPDWQPDTLPLDQAETHSKPLASALPKSGAAIGALQDLLNVLQDVTPTANGFQARCPAHDDQKASLSLTEKDQKILLKCHAGCATEEIVAQLGLTMQDLFLDHPAAAADDPNVVFVRFWYELTINEGEENERTETKIDYGLFLEFLQQNGFGLLCQDDQVRIVRKQNNIISDTIEHRNLNFTIKQFTLTYLFQQKQKTVYGIMLRQHGTFFSTAFLTALRPIKIPFYRDSKTSSALFFRNGFVEIGRQAQGVVCTFRPYANLTKCIWESQILPFEYSGRYHPNPKIDAQESVFKRFLRLVSTEFSGRGDTYEPIMSNLAAFQYSFGYELHMYKNPANARAVIGVDHNSEQGDAKGGRGKSIFGIALNHLRQTSTEDGRTLKTDDNQFIFQTLDLDSQLLFIDDVKPGFDLSVLYNAIVGAMALERKRVSRLILPFKDSPKIYITSNHAILGTGDSHERRWYILPFTDYFSKSYTVMDEFGHVLFDEWDDLEWQRFFDCALECLDVYFTAEKPIIANLATYQESKLKAEISAELLDYFDAWLTTLPQKVKKETFFENFKALYPVYEKHKQNWFTIKLKTYCRLKEIDINLGATDGRLWETDANGKKDEYLRFTKAPIAKEDRITHHPIQ